MSAATSARAQLPLPLCVLETAQDFDGLTETPENRGPGVEWIQRAAGLHPGDPWCLAFLVATAGVACAMHDVPNPLLEVGEPGYVPSLSLHGKAHGWEVAAGDVQPGDLALFWFNSPKGYHHVTIVTDPPYDGVSFMDLGGNSNDDGSREGRRIVRKTRPLRPDRQLFLRPWPAGV